MSPWSFVSSCALLCIYTVSAKSMGLISQDCITFSGLAFGVPFFCFWFYLMCLLEDAWEERKQDTASKHVARILS